MEWVCGRVWVDRVKDDRRRIFELNEDYMPSKGFKIIGEACKGTACGRRDCPLFKRKAVKVDKNGVNTAQVLIPSQTPHDYTTTSKEQREKDRLKAIAFFDNYQPTP